VHADNLPRRHKCDLCEEAFQLKSDLQKHKEQEHSPAHRYKCTECEKSFTERYRLKLHKEQKHIKKFETMAMPVYEIKAGDTEIDPVDILNIYGEKMVLINSNAPPISQRHQFKKLTGVELKFNNGKMTVNKAMSVQNNYVNLISKKRGMTVQTLSGKFDTERLNYAAMWSRFNSTRTYIEDKDVDRDCQYDQIFADKFNISLGTDNEHNENFEKGHCMGRHAGGNDLISNLVYQTKRENRGPVSAIEAFLDYLVTEGYEDISFVSGVIFKDDIEDVYLANNNTNHGIEKDFPIAYYRVYMAKKDGKYFFWSFLTPYFGLPKTNDQFKPIYERTKDYFIDMDDLTRITGIRFANQHQKENLGGINIMLGKQVQCAGRVIKLRDQQKKV
jgi:hypothetical protein